MSEHSNKYAYLRGKSADELNRLLKLAVNPNGEDENDAYVDALLEALAEREYTPEQRAAETDRAWRAFQSAYRAEDGRGLSLFPEEPSQKSQPEQVVPITPSRRKRPRLRRTLLVAAVVACLLMLCVPTALGYQGFLDMIGQWSDEQFHFGSLSFESETDKDKFNKPITPEEDIDYASVEDALSAYGVTALVMPRYIPNEFQIKTVRVDDDSTNGYIGFLALYSAEERALTLSISWTSTPRDGTYEKDSNPVEVYEKGGVTHYFFENNGHSVVAWYNGSFECYIQGDVSMNELKMMIDSIYEG